MIKTQLPNSNKDLEHLKGYTRIKFTTPKLSQLSKALRGLIARSSIFMGFREKTWKILEEHAHPQSPIR